MGKALGSVLAVLALGPVAAAACSFHTYLPEATVVDRLLETENVVLARPAADDPFRFEAVAALEGTLEQADLPTLVDAATRRRLEAHPGDAVLFARDGGAYGPFVRLAYVDAAYREVLETVMARKPDWIMGDDLARYQYFADLLEHPDPEIRQLALRELDAASYDLLRALDLSPAAGPILAEMWDINQIPYLPIRILLLGLSDDPAARDAVLAGLENGSVADGGKTLGAYATALVETDGLAGVDLLAESYLRNPDRDGMALELVVEALAIHAGAGDEEMREHILETLAEFAEARPQDADMIARQFVYRYDFGMADPLRRLVEEGRIKSARALIPVSTYVATAGQGMMSADEFQ